ncbi:PilZ domain-containing protein [Moritella yayanosii]|uniref:Cyclic diguanosine monophosphate-binding protein n=1 Tax=Moritella yayanosii TaxID=69539 RepID=A0A330LJD0_9GAMM|nr:PilZ domain-containing protein [Moritella yayanosii]SQD77227.1 Cyclic diguanosine monophosphate-binding protein [Moritella yayanosii]
MNNKRQFQRVLFNHDASLTCNGHQWSTNVIDLSLRGLSCTKPKNVTFEINQLMTLSIQLAQDQVIIMEAVLIHNEEGVLGMRCTRIDINSISELRRLVQLNLADEALLQRDIEHLALSLPKF